MDHSLPVDAIQRIAGQLESHLEPPPDVREGRMARLHAELARRGASMPIARAPVDLD